MAKKKSIAEPAEQITQAVDSLGQDEPTAEVVIEKSKSPKQKVVKAKTETNPELSQRIEATVSVTEEKQEADKAPQNGMPKAFKKLQSKVEKVERKLKKLTKQVKKKN